jgi:hypothetical protein
MAEETGGRRPTRSVLTAILLFVVAVFLARLLVAGGVAWIVFAACVPILLFVLTARLGFRPAIVGTLLFVLLVLGLKWFLQRSPTGWVALLLLPVLLLTAVLVGRVLGQLRRDRRAKRDEGSADRGSS